VRHDTVLTRVNPPSNAGTLYESPLEEVISAYVYAVVFAYKMIRFCTEARPFQEMA
jgi:hypothetical protein